MLNYQRVSSRMTIIGAVANPIQIFPSKSKIIEHFLEHSISIQLGNPMEFLYFYGILWDSLPSGKHTKNDGQIRRFQWVNPLFLWPFSMGFDGIPPPRLPMSGVTSFGPLPAPLRIITLKGFWCRSSRWQMVCRVVYVCMITLGRRSPLGWLHKISIM